jgi:hypothetical protein
MAIVQDIFSATPAKGYPGMVANGETSNRISRTCEDAGGIAFGKFVYRGAGDQGCTATPGAGLELGVSIADHGVQPLPGGVAADIYPRYASVGIMNRGAIYVTVGEDVTDGAQVYVTPAGAIVDTAAGNTIAVGWFFDETVTNGGICRIVRR